jgi:hypothetical protein
MSGIESYVAALRLEVDGDAYQGRCPWLNY